MARCIAKIYRKPLELSEQYSNEYIRLTKSDNKVILIAYVSAYGYTKEAAELIARGIGEHNNIEVDVVDIEKFIVR